MKNFIRKEVDRQLDGIRDSKDENYNKIAEIYFEPPKPKKKKFFLKIAAPVVASIVLIMGAVGLAGSLKKPAEHVYFADNEVVVAATVEDIKKEAKSFALNFDSYEVTDNKKVYDSKSGDTLKFKFYIKKDYSVADLVYVTNRAYVLETDISMLGKIKNYQGTEVKYYYSFSAFKINVRAYLEKDGQKLIINYSQRSMTDSEDSFWTFVEEFITVK